jgi:hypothetical protein
MNCSGPTLMYELWETEKTLSTGLSVNSYLNVVCFGLVSDLHENDTQKFSSK